MQRNQQNGSINAGGFWAGAIVLTLVMGGLADAQNNGKEKKEKKANAAEKSGKSANSGKAKPAGKTTPGTFGKNIAKKMEEFRAFREPPATLPKNLDGIRPKTVSGRTNLPLSAASAGAPMTVAQLEELLAAELLKEGEKKANGRISDDQFVRRVFLDVIGQLPAPADIQEYVKDTDPNKKAKLIERLLAMPQFGKNWARYWRDVVVYRNTAGPGRDRPFDAETWLAEQFNKNAKWDEMVTAIVTANGLSHENPQGFMYGAHMGEAAELTGEMTRVFLGIQISCAQCHDHPSDVWKRDQFHELASFFGRTSVRIRRDLSPKNSGVPRLVVEIAPGRRDYRKPDLNDPSKPGELVQPVFLTGQAIPMNSTDAQRRQAVASFITSKRNPYFAKAFVNRMWSELIGAGFVNPVDDLGPKKAVAYPKLFDALARSFVATDYDIKALMRTILNSRVYDRQFSEMEGSYDETILFTNITPTRLSAHQVFDAVDWVLGNIDDGIPNLPIPQQRFRGNKGQFEQVFGFDPSLDQAELEGSIPQALALMNNPTLNDRISASRPGTLLNKLLKTHRDDREVVRMLYLRVLARKPMSQEIDTCLTHLKSVGNRAEGFEDVLWGLLNSTEFLHNH